MLRLLASADIPEFHKVFRRATQHQTPSETLFLIMKTFDILFQPQHVELLVEYASQSEQAEKIVRAAATHRAQDFVINTVKKMEPLSEDNVLAASVLGSCHDRSSFNTIMTYLQQAGVEVDFAALVENIETKTKDVFDHFSGCLKLLGVHDAVLKNAKYKDQSKPILATA